MDSRTRPLSMTRASSRGAIVTPAGPRMRVALHDLSLPTFSRYAEQWGWQLVVEDLRMDADTETTEARSTKWAKLRLLRQALQQHPLALWLDADVRGSVNRFPNRLRAQIARRLPHRALGRTRS